MTTPNPAPEAGTYLELGDGRPAVRFERVYDHPVDTVWSLVTEPDELAHWFPSPKVTLDLVPGGAVRFAGDPNITEEQSTGRIIVLDPPRRLAFTWGGDELHIDLEPVGDHRTRFTLTNVLQAPNTAARNAAGWELCLSALSAHATGERSQGAHHGPRSHWEKLYEAYKAAGLPSGAPVPGRH